MKSFQQYKKKYRHTYRSVKILRVYENGKINKKKYTKKNIRKSTQKRKTKEMKKRFLKLSGLCIKCNTIRITQITFNKRKEGLFKFFKLE